MELHTTTSEPKICMKDGKNEVVIDRKELEKKSNETFEKRRIMGHTIYSSALRLFGLVCRGGYIRDTYKADRWVYRQSADIDFVYMHNPENRMCNGSSNDYDGYQEVIHKLKYHFTLLGWTITDVTLPQNKLGYGYYITTLKVETEGMYVMVDISFQTQVSSVDFDVNCFEAFYWWAKTMNKPKLVIQSWGSNCELEELDIWENIRKKVFNIVCMEPKYVKLIHRIHKMECAGWKCNNFISYFKKHLENKYHNFTFNWNIYDSNDKSKCAICYGSIKKGSFIPIMPCTHGNDFHHRCILIDYINGIDKYHCPMCRQEIQ